MSDIKLFRISNGNVEELQGESVTVEKSLQVQVEKHMEEYLGVRFLATEYSTGPVHGGRIDTLGLDENGRPVIVEYKRAVNENVINQGLYYLDWLMDHKGEFKLLVLEKLGKDHAEGIEWASPRLLCIAGDFTKYDEHAVQQINRNIELIRYRRYGTELLLLELVNARTAQSSGETGKPGTEQTSTKTPLEYLQQASQELQDLYEELRSYLEALGDDIQVTQLKNYIAFKRLRNFACVEIQAKSNRMLVFVKVDPSTVPPEKGFARDVRNLGHFGTGDLELTLRTKADLEKAKQYLVKSYEAS